MIYNLNYPQTSGSLDSLPIRENFGFLKTSLDVHASSSFINVKDYGAIGDGIVDDTETIQNSLDSATGGTNGRSIVFFPTGTYKVTSPLEITRKGTIVKGASSIESILRYYGGSSDYVLKTSGSINNFCIQDLCIYGNNIASGAIKLGDSPWVLAENNTYQFYIENVLIKEFSAIGSVGLYLSNACHGCITQLETLSVVGTSVKVEANGNNTGVLLFDNCKLGGYPGTDAEYSIELLSGASSNIDSVVIMGCFIRGSIAGIRISKNPSNPLSSEGVGIWQNHIETHTDNSTGILIEACGALEIKTNTFGALGASGAIAIDFTREGETKGIAIESNYADQYHGISGSFLIRVASSGYSLQDVVYSPFSTTSCTAPYILDSDNQLDYKAILKDGATNLYFNENHSNNDVIIHFGDSNIGFETLKWDNTNRLFTFSEQMRIDSNLSCSGSIFALNYNGFYDDIRIYFNDLFGVDKAYLRYQPDYHNFSIYGDSAVNLFISGWLKSETDVRSKYHMSLNVENIDQNAELRFYKPTSGYETLTYDKTNLRFDMSRELRISEGNGKGIVVADKATGTLYRICVISGSIAVEAI